MSNSRHDLVSTVKKELRDRRNEVKDLEKEISKLEKVIELLGAEVGIRTPRRPKKNRNYWKETVSKYLMDQKHHSVPFEKVKADLDMASSTLSSMVKYHPEIFGKERINGRMVLFLKPAKPSDRETRIKTGDKVEEGRKIRQSVSSGGPTYRG